MESKNLGELEIHTYNSKYFSIKDLNEEIDLSKKKWDSLFDILLEESEAVYFYGLELNYSDDDLFRDISFLSTEVFFEDNGGNILLFNVKNSSLNLSRNLLSRLWKYYWSPGLIFMNNNTQQDLLVNLIKRRQYYEDFLENLTDIKILYMGIERDVLWLEHNLDNETTLF